jgi:hypothetical protein
VKGVPAKLGAILHQLQLLGVVPAVLFGGVVPQARLGANQGDQLNATLALLCHLATPEII